MLTDILKTGAKFDNEKPMMQLLDPYWLTEVAKVLTFGAQKYEPFNWAKGISFTRIIGAAMRHLNAINAGEDYDPETGLPHAAHLSCCAMFLTHYLKFRPEFDDRYRPQTKIAGSSEEPATEQYQTFKVSGNQWSYTKSTPTNYLLGTTSQVPLVRSKS